MAQRALLYDLWDLATTYPNVASKIRVTIRKADPRKDYRYDDDEFADAAIVVSLSWIDAKRACEFLNCVSTYPRNGRCRSRENPRVYPSGDRTTLVACQPACFMMSAIRTSYGRTLDSTELSANEYKSSVAHVMSAHSSEYRKVERNRSTTSASSKYAKLTTTMSAVEKSEDDDSTREPRAPSDESPDLPTLEYDESSDSCEMANSGLITYATQPYFRTIDDGGGATCRLTNFHIGDDVITKKIVPDSADNDSKYSHRQTLPYVLRRIRQGIRRTKIDVLRTLVGAGTFVHFRRFRVSASRSTCRSRRRSLRHDTTDYSIASGN